MHKAHRSGSKTGWGIGALSCTLKAPALGGIIPHNRNAWKWVIKDLCKLLKTGDNENNKLQRNFREKNQMDLIFSSN